MILKYWSGIWAAVAPAMGNHLWQSTLFAIAAGFLTLALQKNRARVRYWLWLTASVKFLVPFSLLIAMGSHLPWWQGSARAEVGLSFVIKEVSQPFPQPVIPETSGAIPAAGFSSVTGLVVPALLAVWLCGFLIVVCMWLLRWRRIFAVIRNATPLQEGREVETLRHLERIERISKPTEILLSRASLEPGIFGMVRPVLVWPEKISARLEDGHLKAILAHELCHIRRRDNLAAAIHMVVEAVFWFHPLVWWLGIRLVEERERACDEEVLEMGSERHVYAESILKICEFCVESPLPCVSGVTGADLKKRMVAIMTKSVSLRLNLGRKLLLGTAGLITVTFPVTLGVLNATSSRAGLQAQNSASFTPSYEVASVKVNEAGTASLKTGKGIIMQSMMFTPGAFTAQNTSLQELIRIAFGVDDYQISGLPNTLASALYDVDAKAGKSAVDELKKLDDARRDLESQRMLQALLMDRFKLTVHRETKELPVYSLVVAEPGKLREVLGDCGPHPDPVIVKEDAPQPPPPCGSLRVFPWVGRMEGLKVPMTQLIANLSGFTKRMVVDNTHLGGKYDMNLKWFPGPSEFPPRPAYLPGTYQPDPNSPPLLTAIQQQLGLKLQPQTGPVSLLVIDHVEMPAKN